MMKRVLTIVVTYNGIGWLDRCLGSLDGQDVFVVDNGSTDGTPEYIRTRFPSVILHCTGENHGFGKANNIGFAYALAQGYDYVYLLNQDAWVFPDTFRALVAAMEEHPEYGILSPVQVTASLDRPDRRFAAKCLDGPMSGYEPGRIYDVPFVMAAHWMMSRKCLETVGGFSPAFRHYGEDDNYLHRAFYHGFKVGFLAGTSAVHDRQDRPVSKEASMRLKCVASVVKVSNPMNCLCWRLLIQPLELLAISVLRRSAYVLRYIPGFLSSYPRLVRLRRQSKTPGAFL